MEKTANDVKGLIKHFHMVQTQLEQITKVQKDLLASIPIQSSKQAYGVSTRGGITTQDPLYPEGHPKMIEQESQLAENNITSSPKKKKKKKRKKHKELGEASNMELDKEPTSNNPNDVSISDAETESGN